MKKIRYLKQTDKSSCGPIALINCMKFLGYPTTGKSLSFLRELCKTENELGTLVEYFDKALRLMTINKAKIKLINKKRYSKTLNHLKKGGGVIMLYLVPPYFYSHFGFFIKKDKFTIYGINTGFELYEDISLAQLKEICSNKYTKIWIIERKENVCT